jgi:hypothetical protein
MVWNGIYRFIGAGILWKPDEKLTVLYISAFFKLTPLHPPLSQREGEKVVLQ